MGGQLRYFGLFLDYADQQFQSWFQAASEQQARGEAEIRDLYDVKR